MGRIQNVLITGATSGIGKQTAYQIATKGKNLILCARRSKKLQEVKKMCKQLGAQNVCVITLDLANTDSIDNLINKLQEKNIQIDILINNAGFGHSNLFIDTDFNVIQNLFRVNVFGLMYLTQKIAINMLESDYPNGQIINVASLAGKVATPHFAPYAASKSAVISFSNALRMELEPHNIQVTVVNFGPVDTPFFDQLQGKRRDKGKSSDFILSEEKAGKIIVNTMNTKKREVNHPILLNIGAKLYNIAPAISDYLLIKYYNK